MHRVYRFTRNRDSLSNSQLSTDALNAVQAMARALPQGSYNELAQVDHESDVAAVVSFDLSDDVTDEQVDAALRAGCQRYGVGAARE